MALNHHRPPRMARPTGRLSTITVLQWLVVLLLAVVSAVLYAGWTMVSRVELGAADASHVSAVPQRNDTRPTIAYAVSLIKCGDHQSNAAGLRDAATVLRHSIHLQHIGSKYDYRMYAIVHRQAEECAQDLKRWGFEVLIKDPPVQQEEIRGKFLKGKIHKEWCCGHHEFVKLYAYTLPHPVVVHMDIDFLLTRPMDHLFDAMLLPNEQRPLNRIERERDTDPWPDQINAFMTRDWPQVMPGRKAGFQAGFIVLRPDPSVVEELVKIIKEGNYVEGFSRENGWGGKGYGGYVGAMAMQGLLAYYYDEHRPNEWVELNQCRYNHMGMDVHYNGAPAFRPQLKKKGHCRNDRGMDCEDCMNTTLEKIYSIHYTQCRKPWNCIGEPIVRGKKTPDNKRNIPTDSVHLDHCMVLHTQWHNVRTNLEERLFELTRDETIRQGQGGNYKQDVFQGHCRENGGDHYLTLSGNEKTLARLPELYI